MAMLAVGALLAVIPITANSGVFGEPKGDTGLIWCGALVLQETDCHQCCVHAGVYRDRLTGVLIVGGSGALLVAISWLARRSGRSPEARIDSPS